MLSYCYLTALGYPFKWSKTREVEWLGMETEYSSYRELVRQGLGQLGSAFKGFHSRPTMLRVIFSWLADRLEGGDKLQCPLTWACPPSVTLRPKMDARGWVAC